MAHVSAQTNNGSNIMNNNIHSSSSNGSCGINSNSSTTSNNNHSTSKSNSSNGSTSNIIGNNTNNTNTGVVLLQRHSSQPIDITASVAQNVGFNKPSAPTVAQQLAFNKMGKKKANRMYEKNLTFSTPVDDPLMDEDFDFEKNLALFDKQAIWDKIDANQKPDLVSFESFQKNKKKTNQQLCVSFTFWFRCDKPAMLIKKWQPLKITGMMKTF